MNIPAPKPIVPKAGSILLASPILLDGVFDNSVIYLNEQGEEGTEGHILNRPTGQTVGDILCSSEFKPLKNIPIHYGGPVAEDKLTFSSFRWIKGRLRCKSCISAQDAIQEMKKSGSLLRAFVGYSGWQKNQLKNELENFAWFTAKPDKSLLTIPQDETMWKNVMQSLSPFHHIISLTPENPFLN